LHDIKKREEIEKYYSLILLEKKSLNICLISIYNTQLQAGASSLEECHPKKKVDIGRYFFSAFILLYPPGVLFNPTSTSSSRKEGGISTASDVAKSSRASLLFVYEMSGSLSSLIALLAPVPLYCTVSNPKAIIPSLIPRPGASRAG